MQKEIDRRVQEEEEERGLEEEEAKGRAVRDFEMLQMGLEVKGGGGGKGGKAGGIQQQQQDGRSIVEVKGGVKRKFELDEGELARLDKEERQKARTIIKDEKVTPPNHHPQHRYVMDLVF